MRIMLIGGNGFIGRRFTRVAIDRGHCVTVVSRSERATELPQNVSWLDGGIDRVVSDPGLIKAYEVVCNFASVSTPASSMMDPSKDISGNLVPCVRLLEAMRIAEVNRLVYLSSGGAVYGPPQYTPIDEEHPHCPISGYGIVKSTVERYIKLYEDMYGFESLIVRPSNPYGPGQIHSKFMGFITTVLKAAITQDDVKFFGDGSTSRDFIYVDDLCAMILDGMERNVNGVFNCGSGVGTSLLEVLRIIESITCVTLERSYEKPRVFDPKSIVLNVSKAATEIGWRPHTSLEEGITKCWNSLGGRIA